MVGGANRSVLMVLEGLKNKYHHQLLVIIPQKGDFSQALDKINIPWMAFAFHEISSVCGADFLNTARLIKNNLIAFKDRKTAKKISKLINAKFDLIYINDNSAYIGAFVAKHLKIPYVWHFRTLLRPRSRFVYGAQYIFGNCYRIIAISDSMKKMITTNEYMPPHKVVRIHNGIPLEKLVKSNQKRNHGMHFVICGRITQDKGHMDAIKEIGLLKNEGISDIVLHIVGAIPPLDSEYFCSLKNECSKLDIEKQVVFEGTRNDMSVFRETMNGELMCSVCEPFGRVTLEGMRSGLVVIGSNTGGTPEIINDGVTGLLYQQGNVEELAQKIKSVYADSELAKKLASNAFEFSRTHFTPDANISAINDILISAIQNKEV